jgi:hypothetical protein
MQKDNQTTSESPSCAAPCSRLADYLESPPPYWKHVTKERLWLVLDAHGDSVLWSDQELAVDAAVAALNAMHKPKCACGKDSTGWVEIKCCNICGLPHKDETLAWGFSPANTDYPHPKCD